MSASIMTQLLAKTDNAEEMQHAEVENVIELTLLTHRTLEPLLHERELRLTNLPGKTE